MRVTFPSNTVDLQTPRPSPCGDFAKARIAATRHPELPRSQTVGCHESCRCDRCRFVSSLIFQLFGQPVHPFEKGYGDETYVALATTHTCDRPLSFRT